MRGKALYRWNVVDKHTGAIVGAYSTERGAKNAAMRFAYELRSPNRYEAVKRQR
jgi:hypothetical protein